MARALLAGGLSVLEITLRTDAAVPAIERIAAEVPDAIVGAGTVLNARDLLRAKRAGAKFIVSPGLTDAVLHVSRSENVMLLPGVATASEIMRGLDNGLDLFKFFPAETSGGVPALKAFAGPFPQVRFCPTCGVTPANAPAYFALSNVLAVGGSWMIPHDFEPNRDAGTMSQVAREATALASRSGPAAN
jgi:2-dehydro-3-deoxyphosphogluconate aldolase/(4S)-4-hydroxy-2-oxoglutarate aldolase